MFLYRQIIPMGLIFGFAFFPWVCTHGYRRIMPTAFYARDKSQSTNYPLLFIHFQLKKLYWAPFSEVLGFDA